MSSSSENITNLNEAYTSHRNNVIFQAALEKAESPPPGKADETRIKTARTISRAVTIGKRFPCEGFNIL